MYESLVEVNEHSMQKVGCTEMQGSRKQSNFLSVYASSCSKSHTFQVRFHLFASILNQSKCFVFYKNLTAFTSGYESSVIFISSSSSKVVCFQFTFASRFFHQSVSTSTKVLVLPAYASTSAGMTEFCYGQFIHPLRR